MATTIQLEKILQLYIAQVKSGERASILGDSASISSLSTDDEELWTQLKRDLQAIGIGPNQFNNNRDLILRSIQDAFFDETEEDSLLSASIDSGSEMAKQHISSQYEHPAPNKRGRVTKFPRLRRIFNDLTNDLTNANRIQRYYDMLFL